MSFTLFYLLLLLLLLFYIATPFSIFVILFSSCNQSNRLLWRKISLKKKDKNML
jgi:hypothetical protein